MSFASISNFKEHFHNSEFFLKKYRDDVISILVIGLIFLGVLLYFGYYELKILAIPFYILFIYGLGYWTEIKGRRTYSLIFNNLGALLVPYITIMFPDVRLESLILISFAISGLVYNDTERWMRNLFVFYLAAFFFLQLYETYFYWDTTPSAQYKVLNTIVLYGGIISTISSIVVFYQVYTYFIKELLQKEVLIQSQVRDLNLKNDELEKYIHSNLQLENFAYIASHDLKAPMRTIVSFTQLLERSLGKKLQKQEQEYLEFIISGTKSLEQLTNDLLTFSRVNSTQRIIEDVNVEDLLEEVCQGLRKNIEDKKAVIDIDQLPSSIRADKLKLKLLFQNFITNSLKFVRPEIDPNIKISYQDSGEYWKFKVKDNGIGIEAEFQEKIFLLFKRLHNQTEYEGTGIGLALCKKLVAQHEGEIWLTSTPGQGSEFSFSIKKGLA